MQQTFAALPNEIPLYLFVERGGEDVYVDACRQVVRAFRELTDKITLKEYYLDHEMARKWNVESSPTLVVDPEHYNIKWIGAPHRRRGAFFPGNHTACGDGQE